MSPTRAARQMSAAAAVIALAGSAAAVAQSTTTTTPAPASPGCPLDLTFVLDSSGSITGDARDEILLFAKRVTSEFTVSLAPSDTRVSVVEFASLVSDRLALGAATSNAAADTALSQPRDNTILQQTDTPNALNYVKNTVYTGANGARSSGPVKRVVVVVTDTGSTRDGGVTSLTAETGAAADALRAKGVTVIAVGFGRESDITPELLAIAGGDSSLVFMRRWPRWLKGLKGAVVGAIMAAPCPPPTCPLDLSFVIDSSGSITGDARNDMLNLAKKIANEYIVSQGADDTRVSVLEYASLISARLQLSGATSNAAVDTALSQPRDTTIRQQTDTPNALNYVKTAVFTGASGARPSPPAKRVVVVITDTGSTRDGGVTSLTAETGAAADALRAEGVTVIAVGFGRSSDITPELLAIAGGDANLVFQQRWSYWLNSRKNAIVNAINTVPCPVCSIDLSFVLDSSGSITGDARDDILDFAKRVAADFTVSLEPSDTRVSVVEFASLISDRLTLGAATSNAAVDTALSQPRDNTILQQTDTPNALNYVKNTVFTAVNGARPSPPSKQIVVVVTDTGSTRDGGVTSLTAETGAAADALRATGATVIAVGFGRDSDITPELLAIAGGDADLVFKQRWSYWLNSRKNAVVAAIVDAAGCPAPEAEELSGAATGGISTTASAGVVAGVAALALVAVVVLGVLRPRYVLRRSDSSAEGSQTDATELEWDSEVANGPADGATHSTV